MNNFWSSILFYIIKRYFSVLGFLLNKIAKRKGRLKDGKKNIHPK
ncbi:hypothetical protein [Spiroplasma endosymbiont of Amphimallon solstitiale]